MVAGRGRKGVMVLSMLLIGGWGSARASEDWPQAWGPRGDGRSLATFAHKAAPKLNARELWRRPIGSAFSGISVVKGRAYTGLADGTNDHVIAFDPASGKETWRSILGPTY